MLRTIFFFILVLPVTFVFSCIALAVPSLGSWVMRTWSGWVLALAGVRLDADLSALDPDTTYVFMANHQSQIDILALSKALKDWGIRFVAKQSLFSIPVFGWAMRRVGNVAIDRSNRRRAMKSIDNAAASVKSGVSMVIFPEGTRATDHGELQEFKIGGMIVALKTGAPVVPLVLCGSGAVLPKGKAMPRPGTVRIKALKPVDAAATYGLKQREVFKHELHQTMNSAYQEMLHG